MSYLFEINIPTNLTTYRVNTWATNPILTDKIDEIMTNNIKVTYKCHTIEVKYIQPDKESIPGVIFNHNPINRVNELISNTTRTCHLCGKEFTDDSTVRRHIEQVHKVREEIQEQKNQTFSMFLAREWYVAVRGGNYTRKGSQARREDLKKEKENLKLEEENLSKRKIMLYKKGILSKIKKHNNWSRRKKEEKKL